MKFLIPGGLALAVAISGFGASLIPAGSDFCLFGHTWEQPCPEDRAYYKGSDGRCGCLKENSFYSKEQCVVLNLICTEEAPYTTIDDIDGNYVGCGCFYTIR